MRRLVAACVAVLLAAAAALPSAAHPQAPISPAERAHTLVIGKITSKPYSAYPKLQAFAGYLAKALAGVGIERAAVVTARDTPEMVRLLRQGRVDMLSDTIFSALTLEAQAPAELLLREWKSGTSTYCTLFITRVDSPIRTLADLAGHSIALHSRHSTSGYALPLLAMRQAGLHVVEKRAGDAAAGDVVFERAGDDQLNLLAWVQRQRVDAAVVSDVEWRNPDDAPEILKRDLRVFHMTQPLIRSVLLVRRDMPAPLKDALTDLLLTMDRSAEGRAALDAYYGVEKYDRLTGDARADLDYARELFQLVTAGE